MGAPERIGRYAYSDINIHYAEPPAFISGATEYVRADLYDALKAERDALLAALEPMRTGDSVYHIPSQEEWVVAWADYQSGYMAPCGWPECEAKIVDCVVVRRANDAEADKLIRDLEKSGRRDASRARRLVARAALTSKEPE